MLTKTKLHWAWTKQRITKSILRPQERPFCGWVLYMSCISIYRQLFWFSMCQRIHTLVPLPWATPSKPLPRSTWTLRHRRAPSMSSLENPTSASSQKVTKCHLHNSRVNYCTPPPLLLLCLICPSLEFLVYTVKYWLWAKNRLISATLRGSSKWRAANEDTVGEVERKE